MPSDPPSNLKQTEVRLDAFPVIGEYQISPKEGTEDGQLRRRKDWYTFVFALCVLGGALTLAMIALIVYGSMDQLLTVAQDTLKVALGILFGYIVGKRT